MLEATLESERVPYTQNDHYLETATQAWLDKYKAVRSGKVSGLDPQAKKQKVAESKDSRASAFASTS